MELLANIHHDNEAVAVELEKQMLGELLENRSFAWATPEREGINMLYASYANNLVNWLLACERYPEALQIARRMIARDAFDEETNRLLVHILGAMGDKHALHHHYQRYVEMMQQELNLQPSVTMQQLYREYK